MRLGFFSSLAGVLAGTGLILAQAPVRMEAEQSVQVAANAEPAPLAAPSALVPLSPTGPGSSYSTYGTSPCPEAFSDKECCPTRPRCLISAEYLLWRFGEASLPSTTAVNVQAGTITVNARDIFINGTPNQVTTTRSVPVLVQVDAGAPGNNALTFNDQPGVRLRGTYWCDNEQCFGIDGSYFFQWRRTVAFTNVNPPFTQVLESGLEQQIFAVSSTATTTTTTEVGDPEPVFIQATIGTSLNGRVSNRIWGADFNGRCRVVNFGPIAFDFLAGFRYMDIMQKLETTEVVTLSPSGGGQTDPTPPPSTDPQFFQGAATLAAPVTNVITDAITARNQFYGVQIGSNFDYTCGYGVSIFGYGKLAVGDMHQRFELLGNTAGNNAQAGGLLVGPGDTGAVRKTDRVCVIPEFNINLGYDVINNVRLFGGYNIIYISSLGKVSNQLTRSETDTSVVFGEEPTSNFSSQPGFQLEGADAVLQGLNLGVEVRY